VPRLVNGPCLLNVVWGGKTPDLDLRQAEAMGYKLAIVPGLLIKSVVGICDRMLAELTTTHRHPTPLKEMTVPEMFRRFGADEWDALRDRFRTAPAAREAAE
jgi:2-methylisocitrate lyase-like PEP mutase family enzyme